MLIAKLALLFQVTVTVGTNQAGVRVDDDERAAPRRIPVTAEHLRTAFKDERARVMLERARAARVRQDSSLVSYDARTYQRLSVGMSIRETARERLFFRTENASRVRWHRNGGAEIEVLGARSALPAIREARSEVEEEMRNEAGEMAPLPYYPGKEPLISIGSNGRMAMEVNERDLVHPLAIGSEAYYTYASGDSVTMVLPDGKRLQLRELRIAAREPRWNVAVGSFWFEAESGHLVRAVYRMSAQMDIKQVAEQDDSTTFDDVPLFIKPILFPMQAEITAMSIEYGLQEQRFWMPKLQALEGYARVSLMRVPFRVEERYRYESVNALDSVPVRSPEPRVRRSDIRDSLYALGLDSSAVRDSVTAYYARRDTLRRDERRRQCAATGRWVSEVHRGEANILTRTIVPCDSTVLSRSSELPPSIFDAGEELFGESEVRELMRTLDMGLQPGWAPQQPVFAFGYALMRYNRVEGLGTAVNATMTLGSGYTADGQLRASLGDVQLNGELGVSRSNGRWSYRGGAFRRLAVSSDFGDPLSFGASLAGLLYARDEGFYHRAWGLELTGERPIQRGLTWRLFSEQQFNAPVESRWTLFRGANDSRFIANVAATKGWYHGVGMRWVGSYGFDPNGFRASADVRAEAAAGDASYQRLFAETIVSQGLGPITASLTTAAGAGFGQLPAQRQFFLGGLRSVRGQTAGTAIGESFWMTRSEIGTASVGMRPVVYADLGWAGPRNGWNNIGRPISGVGIGASFLDGMARIDVARGIHPKWQTRVDLYFEARF